MRMIGRPSDTPRPRAAYVSAILTVVAASVLSGCAQTPRESVGTSAPQAGSGLSSQPSSSDTGTGDTTPSGSGEDSGADASSPGSSGETERSEGGSSGATERSATGDPTSRASVVQLSRRYGRIALAEQIASQTNISKLAGGRITVIDIDSSVRSGSRWVAQIGATFKDGTYGAGELVLTNYEGFWYFTSITGKRTGATGGDADSVNDSGVGGTPLGLATDMGLINIFAQQTRANQSVYRDMVAGKWDRMDVKSVAKGLSTATLKVSLNRTDGSGADAGTIGMLRKNKRWYVVRFTRP